MFNAVLKSQINLKEIKQENQTKDFKKLATYILKAKGYRTINGFASECKTNANYVADLINARSTSYPTVQFLKLIADNSEGRVSLNDLKTACGYSLYENNDMEQIKNIYVRRGWFCYANFGDQAMDSEYSGYRLVLIVQNDTGNKFSSTTLAIPVTSRRSKKNLPTHVSVGANVGLQMESIISCEQTRCISKRRLIQNGIVQKIAECPTHIMQSVEIALLKAEGVLDLNIDEAEAIEVLRSLNENKVIRFRTETKTNETTNENKNYSRTPQMAFA